jgi:hypothetical protein
MAKAQATTNRARAWRLFAGGVLGGVLAWILALPSCLIAFGPQVWPIVVLAGAGALLFFVLGQLVQVLFAEAQPVAVMMAGLTSYVVRVGGLAGLAYLATDLVPQLNTGALVVTLVSVVIGWLSVEIWVFSRLRIPAFDSPQAKTD